MFFYCFKILTISIARVLDEFFFRTIIDFICVITQRMCLIVQFIFPHSLQVRHLMYSNIGVVIVRCFCTVM